MKVYIEFANYSDGENSSLKILAVRTDKESAYSEVEKYEKDLKAKIDKAIVEYNKWAVSDVEYELDRETIDYANNDFINCSVAEIELDSELKEDMYV